MHANKIEYVYSHTRTENISPQTVLCVDSKRSSHCIVYSTQNTTNKILKINTKKKNKNIVYCFYRFFFLLFFCVVVKNLMRKIAINWCSFKRNIHANENGLFGWLAGK